MSGGRVWRVVVDHPGKLNPNHVRYFCDLTDDEARTRRLVRWVEQRGGRAHVEWADLGPWTKENQ